MTEIQPEVWRKKPVAIQAVQFNVGEHTKREWLAYVPEANIGAPMARDAEGKLIEGSDMDSTDIQWFIIPTLEGHHEADDGDWLITGVANEHYFCKPGIFGETYDRVTDKFAQLAISAARAAREAKK